MKISDKARSTGEGNGKQLQYSSHKNSKDSIKGQKDMTSEDEHPPPHSEGVQYTNEEEWKAITNNSRKNEASGPKRKKCSVVDISSGENKVQ